MQTLLAELLAPLELLEHSIFLGGGDHPRARWPLIHLDLVASALSLLLLLLTIPLQILRHFCHIFGLEVLLLGDCLLYGHLVHLVLHLILFDAPHVLFDEVLFVVDALTMVFNHRASLVVDRLGLEVYRGDLGWDLGELLHFEGLFHLYSKVNEIQLQ